MNEANHELLKSLSDIISSPVTHFHTVSGGDINEAYSIDTLDGRRFFVKVNHRTTGSLMFEEEAKALRFLANITPAYVPKVICTGHNEQSAFLILDWIDVGTNTEKDWKNAGKVLAAIHRTSQKQFGWPSDNFIGSLKQSNNEHKSWSSFYLYERIMPQVELAQRANLLDKYSLKNLEQLYVTIPDIVPDISPNLIHGDLWNGNLIFDRTGQPVFIDPAICFADREMDIAMSYLFGGFDRAFYASYNHHYPLLPEWNSRLELYQLYYLLVHLNLFGQAYLSGVNRIVKTYI